MSPKPISPKSPNFHRLIFSNVDHFVLPQSEQFRKKSLCVEGLRKPLIHNQTLRLRSNNLSYISVLLVNTVLFVRSSKEPLFTKQYYILFDIARYLAQRRSALERQIICKIKKISLCWFPYHILLYLSESIFQLRFGKDSRTRPNLHRSSQVTTCYRLLLDLISADISDHPKVMRTLFSG